MAELQQVEVRDLIPYINNAKTHPEEQVIKIAASIKEFGFNAPILVDGDNQIIAGHGRLQAAKKIGLKAVPVVVLDHLSEAQKKAYILADNRLGEVGGTEWDMDLVSLELEELQGMDFDLDLTGFSIDDIAPEETEGLTDEDSVPEVPEEPVSKDGDVWILGKHRLMCGNSTSIDAVDKLMDGSKADMVFTDPPYGIEYKSNWSKKFDVIKNDDDFLDIRPILDEFCKPICPIYIWTSHQVFHIWREMFSDLYKSTIIWYKKFGGMGDLKAEYGHNYEMCLYLTKNRVEFVSDRPKAVWEIGGDSPTKYQHPTQKPVELSTNALSHHNSKNILDLFLGSGSTLIAAEKKNRKCYGMELDPKYIDVIIKRWQDYTGKKAIHAESGDEFVEVDNGKI